MAKTKRYHQRQLERATYDQLNQIGKMDHKRVAKVQVIGNSGFYNAAELVAIKLQESIDKAMSMKQCRQVDPATIPCPQLTGIDLKRAIAKKTIMRYMKRGEFMTRMFHRMKYFPLTEAECDGVARAAATFRERDAKKCGPDCNATVKRACTSCGLEF
jgi:hypothetical protein